MVILTIVSETNLHLILIHSAYSLLLDFGECYHQETILNPYSMQTKKKVSLRVVSIENNAALIGKL